MRRVYKHLCPATISASIMAANMWKNSLKNVESDNNKILHETLLDFLQRNVTYFLNRPRSIKIVPIQTTMAGEGRGGGLEVQVQPYSSTSALCVFKC